MSHEHVCPWWIGYILASPIRRLVQKPETIVGPFVKDGMRVLEIGPGMGFFTLPMARMVGPKGKIIAVDIQEKMLAELRRRARKAGLADRVEIRLIAPDESAAGGLRGSIDFALLMAVVHEVPDAQRLFTEVYEALKPGSAVLVAEPKSHVPAGDFDCTVAAACRAGFVAKDKPRIRASLTSVLVKPTQRP